MTEISFHTRVPDLIGYGCRLLRKAAKKGARVAVCAEPELLQQLDRALWTFEPLDFTPHARLAPGAAMPPRLAPTPIWLLEAGGDAPLAASPVHGVLVNFGPSPVPGFESFERVVELVGAAPEQADAGRRRWRHYAERGYRIEHHNAGAPPSPAPPGGP